MLYLIVMEGPRADQAKPIVAISDEVLIKYVLTELGRTERWCKQGASGQMDDLPRKGDGREKAKAH